MRLSEERSTLDAVLFIRRISRWNAQAILNEHQFNPDHVIAHDPFAPDLSIPEDDRDWADVRWTEYVAQFLNQTRPKKMVSYVGLFGNKLTKLIVW
jgi:hypothetical protein